MKVVKEMNSLWIPVKKASKSLDFGGLTFKKNLKGYLFILPFLIGLVTIFLPSIYYSIQYSFSKVTINLDSLSIQKVGFLNYYNAFAVDTKFRVLITSAIQGMLLDLIIIIIFSFFVASILNQKFLGRGFARMIFFLPVLLSAGIIASVDAGNLIMNTFNSTTNTNTTISSAFTNSAYSFLFSLDDLLKSTKLNSSVIQVIISAVDNTYDIVNASGVQILIFLSALQSISPSIFESAEVEGATKWEEFWKITFPMITPMILVNVIYTIVDTFTNPKYGILAYIQAQGFDNNQLGFASALSWIYFIVIILIMGIICGAISKRIQYLD